MNPTAASVDIGHVLPDLTLLDDQGADVALRELTGQRTVLYFYPKDDTPGCTTQACAIRDSWSEFEPIEDVAVYGVSPDDAASHAKFRSKLDLPFRLLVDDEHRLADALGFWVEKKNYGKAHWGVQRSTVIVGADGRVRAVARNVKPDQHMDWLRTELGLA